MHLQSSTPLLYPVDVARVWGSTLVGCVIVDGVHQVLLALYVDVVRNFLKILEEKDGAVVGVLVPPFRSSPLSILNAHLWPHHCSGRDRMIIFYHMDVFHVVYKVICAPPPIGSANHLQQMWLLFPAWTC